MKVIVVPLLKKLAAALVSFIPLREIGQWALTADLWTLVAIGISVTSLLVWFFGRYLPKNKHRLLRKLGRNAALPKLKVPPMKSGATYRAKVWQRGRMLAEWLIVLATTESKGPLANESRTATRPRTRSAGVEPDAGPTHTMRRVVVGRGRVKR